MRDDIMIGVDDPALAAAMIEALAEAHPMTPPPRLAARVPDRGVRSRVRRPGSYLRAMGASWRPAPRTSGALHVGRGTRARRACRAGRASGRGDGVRAVDRAGRRLAAAHGAHRDGRSDRELTFDRPLGMTTANAAPPLSWAAHRVVS